MIYRHFLLWLILTLICINNLTKAKKKFKGLYFRELYKNFNRKYVDTFDSAISKDHQAVNITVFVNQETPADLWAQFNIHFKEPVTKKFRKILSYDINACSVLSLDLGRVKIIEVWLDNLLKYSNMPRNCPWKAGLYYWYNFRPDKESIPPFTVNGLYFLNIRFYFHDLNDELFTNTTALVDIKIK